MNMEAQVNHAVELATDAAAEAYSVADKPNFIHTKESWADCLADLITDPENDEGFRRDIEYALYWLDAMNTGHYDKQRAIGHATEFSKAAKNIGIRVIQNAIKNGITLETIGKVE
jgi:hypothetical protein